MIGVGALGHTGTVSVTSNLTYANGFLAVTDIVRDSNVCSHHLIS